MTISSIAAGSYASAQKLSPVSKSDAAKPDQDFASLVKDGLQSVSKQANMADREIGRALSGETDLIGVVTAVAESETAVQTLVSVRDKVIAAYEDVMRMTI